MFGGLQALKEASRIKSVPEGWMDSAACAQRWPARLQFFERPEQSHQHAGGGPNAPLFSPTACVGSSAQPRPTSHGSSSPRSDAGGPHSKASQQGPSSPKSPSPPHTLTLESLALPVEGQPWRPVSHDLRTDLGHPAVAKGALGQLKKRKASVERLGDCLSQEEGWGRPSGEGSGENSPRHRPVQRVHIPAPPPVVQPSSKRPHTDGKGQGAGEDKIQAACGVTALNASGADAVEGAQLERRLWGLQALQANPQQAAEPVQSAQEMFRSRAICTGQEPQGSGGPAAGPAPAGPQAQGDVLKLVKALFLKRCLAAAKREMFAGPGRAPAAAASRGLELGSKEPVIEAGMAAMGALPRALSPTQAPLEANGSEDSGRSERSSVELMKLLHKARGKNKGPEDPMLLDKPAPAQGASCDESQMNLAERAYPTSSNGALGSSYAGMGQRGTALSANHCNAKVRQFLEASAQQVLDFPSAVEEQQSADCMLSEMRSISKGDLCTPNKPPCQKESPRAIRRAHMRTMDALPNAVGSATRAQDWGKTGLGPGTGGKADQGLVGRSYAPGSTWAHSPAPTPSPPPFVKDEDKDLGAAQGLDSPDAFNDASLDALLELPAQEDTDVGWDAANMQETLFGDVGKAMEWTDVWDV